MLRVRARGLRAAVAAADDGTGDTCYNEHAAWDSIYGGYMVAHPLSEGTWRPVGMENQTIEASSICPGIGECPQTNARTNTNTADHT